MRKNLPYQALSLQQFIIRKQVIELYRGFLKIIRHAPKVDQQHMREWVRRDFEANRHLTDEVAIKMQLSRGRLALREMSSAIHMAK